MPDGGAGYELVNGELKELAMSTESNRIAGRISARLDAHCDATGAGWVFPQDSPFCCFPDDPNRIRKPDAAFVSITRMPVESYQEEGYCQVVPEIVAEVISPHDKAREVQEKITEWLAAGVRLLWEVYPESRTIRVHRPGHPIELCGPGDTLTAPDVLPDFAVPVAELFRKPGEAKSVS
jgi:Uma2 family endonuclease